MRTVLLTPSTARHGDHELAWAIHSMCSTMECNAWCVFGDFSAEEAARFFQSSHISVELPPWQTDETASSCVREECLTPQLHQHAVDTFDHVTGESQEVNIVHTPLAPFSCLNPRAPEFKYPAPIPAQPSGQGTTLSAQPSVPTHLIVSGPTNKAAIPSGPSCPVLTSTSGLPSVLPPLLGTATQGRPGLSESPPASVVAAETTSVTLQEINVQLPPAGKEQQDLEQAGEDLGSIEESSLVNGLGQPSIDHSEECPSALEVVDADDLPSLQTPISTCPTQQHPKAMGSSPPLQPPINAIRTGGGFKLCADTNFGGVCYKLKAVESEVTPQSKQTSESLSKEVLPIESSDLEIAATVIDSPDINLVDTLEYCPDAPAAISQQAPLSSTNETFAAIEDSEIPLLGDQETTDDFVTQTTAQSNGSRSCSPTDISLGLQDGAVACPTLISQVVSSQDAITSDVSPVIDSKFVESEVDMNSSPVKHRAPDIPNVTVSSSRSWASLFHSPKSQNAASTVTTVASPVTATILPSVSPKPAAAEKTSALLVDSPATEMAVRPASEDPVAPAIAEFLNGVHLQHKQVATQPRGLVNRGNWCYINSTLQALVMCSPLYNVLRGLLQCKDISRTETCTPMLDGLVKLVKEFGPPLLPAKPKPGVALEKTKDLRLGTPFEPTFIYKLLTVIKSSMCEKGRQQEDAEEFLSFVFNQLHEEMFSLKQLLNPALGGKAAPNGLDGKLHEPGDHLGGDQQDDEEEEEWEQVYSKNRSAITRSADMRSTIVTDIFGGQHRAILHQHGSRESATLEPFFTLPLDIQPERVTCLKDALEGLVAREAVQGYTSKNKREVEVSRRIMLEKLPPILILHLKCFLYNKTGGSQKLMKTIEYPTDLEISKDLLSLASRNKFSKGQRSYRLFAVTYHHGKNATGGHYTTGVYHTGLGYWLHIDDQNVRLINLQQVLKPGLPRTAYLLYYRRADLA
uniref:ubiquitin carboxyl-terminal hydrolase 10 isoform X2 n=1 Tax=Myxine glutinosa TaxID=7769 RepID=UPI00358FDEFF